MSSPNTFLTNTFLTNDRDFATLATTVRSVRPGGARADWQLEVVLHGMRSVRRSRSEHS